MESWYLCKNCNNSIIVIKEYGQDWKKTIKCSECGKRMIKDIVKNMREGTIHIPDHMKSTGESKLNYSKMSREEKSIY